MEKKMRIITWRRLKEFGESHPDAESSLRAWRSVVEKAQFQNPAGLKAVFPKASIIGKYRTVFDIGRQYRLVVDVRYDLGRIYVRAIMTHDEYDRIDVRKL